MKKHANNCKSSGRSVLECDCDGYHTFDELYAHRIMLYITLCKKLSLVMDKFDEGKPIYDVWRTKTHSDGTSLTGWFVLGINKEKNRQITYHLPMDCWDDCAFADTLDRAPEFDGHTSYDVLGRLALL